MKLLHKKDENFEIIDLLLTNEIKEIKRQDEKKE
jgi:hypothetical protein